MSTIRESLREAWAVWETKTGIQRVKDMEIGYDDGGFKIVMAHGLIRDELLTKVESMLKHREDIIDSLPHSEDCPVALYWKHNWEGEVKCNCGKSKVKEVQS